jgi:hypothetical protein
MKTLMRLTVPLFSILLTWQSFAVAQVALWAQDPWKDLNGGFTAPSSSDTTSADWWHITMLRNDMEQAMIGVMNTSSQALDISVAIDTPANFQNGSISLAVLGAIEAEKDTGLVNIFTPAQVKSFGGAFPVHFRDTDKWKDFPTLHLPPGRPARLWFRVSTYQGFDSTHLTPAGTYPVHLTVRAANQTMIAQRTIQVEVLSAALPLMMPVESNTWGGYDETTDRTYHTTVSFGETNHLGYQHYSFHNLLVSAGLWSSGLTKTTDLYNSDPAQFSQKIRAALDAYNASKATAGWSAQQILVEIFDEPGLSEVHGFNLIAAEIKRYKPATKIVANPWVQDIRIFQGLDTFVDVWIPHTVDYTNTPIRNFLKSTGKPLWFYCNWLGNDARNEEYIFGYFRSYGWIAVKHGLQGIGFWSATSYYGDKWNDFDGSWNDAAVVFPSSAGPIVTREYEAWRETVEDIAMYKMIQHAHDNAKLPQNWIDTAGVWLQASADQMLTSRGNSLVIQSVRAKALTILSHLSPSTTELVRGSQARRNNATPALRRVIAGFSSGSLMSIDRQQVIYDLKGQQVPRQSSIGSRKAMGVYIVKTRGD